MGWNTMPSTITEVKLTFETMEAAIAYAESKQIDYRIHLPHKPAVGPKAYAENFSFNRRRAFEGE
jgi:hypothetical protein